jgi:hypothetical protein
MSDQTRRFQCRHIFTDGHRCGSACLSQEEFCYYHHTSRRPVENPRRRRSRQSQFDLPLPEDRTAIQSSIGEVLRRIAGNEIDCKRAGLLLYGLQIASINLPRASRAAERSTYTSRSRYRTLRDEEDIPETTLVEEIVIDPKLGTIAPRAEVAEAEENLSVVGQLVRRFELERQQEEREKAEAAAKAESDAARPAPEPGAPQLALSLPKSPALEDIGEAPQRPHQADEIIPLIHASEEPRHASQIPKLSNPRRRRKTSRNRACYAAIALPANAGPPKPEKSTEKLTRHPRIAIVRGFREYPGRAVRETQSAEGWRKAQAN